MLNNLSGSSPDLNPSKYLWDDVECQLRTRPSHLTSVPHLTNALMIEWAQIPTAIFQNLVESIPKRVDAVITAKGKPPSGNDNGFEIGTYGWDGEDGEGTVTYDFMIFFNLLSFCQNCAGTLFM